LLAGATAVQIGTAVFSNPNVAADVRDGLVAYLGERGIGSVREILGRAFD
ncbi:MAG: dihydroorotate dehydrogenase, partial [Candidatus Dadabacteria bacterium]